MVRLNKKLNPSLTGHEAEKLHGDLRKRVVGQEDAVDQIVSIYQTYLAGMTSPGRPIGNFLFLGPTGTGKTRLVEAVADKEEQLGRLVDHVINEVRQREGRKQDRDDACDPNCPRCFGKLPSRPPCAPPPAAKAGEEAVGFC